MANWCFNKIKISGDKEDLKNISQIINKLQKNNDSEIGLMESLVGREPYITEEEYNNIEEYKSLIPKKGNIKILYDNELSVTELIKEIKKELPEVKICKQEIINIRKNNEKIELSSNILKIEELIEEYMKKKYPEIENKEIKEEIIKKLDNMKELNRQDMSK